MPTRPAARRPHTARPASPDRAREAFERLRPQFAAIELADTVPVNTDIPTAVSIALGAAGPLLALREQVVTELPKFPVKYIDQLEEIALGAWYAYLRTLPTESAPGAVETLVAQAAPLRKGLLVAAEALADRELVSRATVDQIRAGNGHLDTANDLVALGALFRDAWPRIHNRTAIAEEELARATDVGTRLVAAIGFRDNPASAVGSEPLETRARAFTLLVRAYNECRHASRYLRRNEADPDALTPSLFARRVRKGGRSETDGEGTDENTGETPAPTPAA